MSTPCGDASPLCADASPPYDDTLPLCGDMSQEK
jgi:hypothetical protein